MMDSDQIEQLQDWYKRYYSSSVPSTTVTFDNRPSKTKSDGSSTDYYKIPPNATDIIDLIEFKNMNFSIGNIFKACYRIGQKEGNDDAYDLRKMIFFAQRELARITK